MNNEEINKKFESLKQEYIKTLNQIENEPLSSINDISKIIYNNVMNLGNKTLEVWLNEKIKNESDQKKTSNN
jgi:hypothetical protein